MMNTNFKVLHLSDTLRTVVEYYHEYKISTLPVVDENESLIDGQPSGRIQRIGTIHFIPHFPRCGILRRSREIFLLRLTGVLYIV
jgi:hypothetical protein